MSGVDRKDRIGYQIQPWEANSAKFLSDALIPIVEKGEDITRERLEQMIIDFHIDNQIDDKHSFTLKHLWVVTGDWITQRQAEPENSGSHLINMETIEKTWALLTEMGLGD
jgi:hypothetical protein